MTTGPSILIVAGEASADLHGAKVMAALKAHRPDAQVFGIGGSAMRAEGLDAIAHAEQISVAGLTEVLFALPRVLGIMRRLLKAASERRPSVAILIDLPDFNMRVAKRLKKLGVPVVYYISPQIWAWRQGRIKQIKELVSQMLVVLPFEQSFYTERGVRARFVGHPLVEELPAQANRGDSRDALGLPSSQGPVVAVLPGSRMQEVNRHLPTMLQALQLLKRRFPDLVAVLPIASTIPRALIDKMVEKVTVPITLVEGRSTEALVASDAAIVCSGTATLQTALLSRPMVVVYRVSWLTYHILKRLIKVAHISLVNLIAGHTVVPELVQHEFTAARVEKELSTLLADSVTRVRLNQDFANVRKQLGGVGTAQRVAEVLETYLPEPNRGDGNAPTTGRLWG